MSGGYRAPANSGQTSSQQNYGNNYSGGNALHPHPPPPPQQPYYGQPPSQMSYHQPISNNYQQMGQIPRPLNPSQSLDTRGYVQPQISMQNRS